MIFIAGDNHVRFDHPIESAKKHHPSVGNAMFEWKDTVAVLSKPLSHRSRPNGFYSTPPARHTIAERLCERVDAVLNGGERESARIWQIRIKIGGLRVSWLGGGVRMSARKEIEEAVSAADATCEVCGAPAKRRRTASGVVLVSCWKHRGGWK
jgi:hypothetical protein